MKLSYIFYTSLIALTVMLTSCGGGGGSSGNTSNNIVTSSNSTQSSSSESSVVTPPVVIAPDDQTFTLDEDTTLSSEIKVYLDYVAARSDAEKPSRIVPTLKGGVVEITPLVDANDPRVYFTYKPSEDFHGDDECVIYLTKFNAEQLPNTQKIKLHFHVHPVVDEEFKFSVNNKKVFIAGDQVQLSSLRHPDTLLVLTPDSSFKLTVDNVPVNYSIDANGVSFIMPTKVIAGVNHVNIDFRYEDKLLSVSRPIRSKIDYGDVEYLMGDKNRAGVTYVVFAEKRVDQQAYLNWINTEFSIALNEPLIAEYSGYWNLAVIKQIAPENYASINTDFSSAILIGDLGETGESFIKRFVPNYDWVVLNTNLDGRATGGYPMTVNFSPITTILHEFGHVHAKLGDEYSDQSLNRDATYVEGSNPNITNYKDYDLIPWKHWIANKTNIPGVHGTADLNGVGAFLGASYLADKFYRPMRTSIMGNTDAPFGPVNSEAWVLATYERMGILGSMLSTKQNSIRTLSLTKQWDKNLTRIDWFVNDVKQDEWTNKSSVAVDETNLAATPYSVKTELTDLSMYIKDPHAYASFKVLEYADLIANNFRDKKNENFQKIWIFEKSADVTAHKFQKQQIESKFSIANGGDWISHKITIQDGAHKLIESSIYSQQDTLVPVTARSEFRADVFDAIGQRIYSVGIDNPYLHYHGAAGLVTLKDRGAYRVKHPRIEGDYKISIFNQRTNQVVLTLSFP